MKKSQVTFSGRVGVSSRLRFGTLIPPYHLPVNYNPTYALQRDIEIIPLADMIGRELDTRAVRDAQAAIGAFAEKHKS